MPGRRRACSTSSQTAASRRSASSTSSTACARAAFRFASSLSTRRREASVAERVSVPAGFYWTIGVAVSLGLYAGLIGAVALLAGRYAEASVAPEITFSDEASPAVDPVKSRAEPAAPSEVAKTADREKLAPAA